MKKIKLLIFYGILLFLMPTIVIAVDITVEELRNLVYEKELGARREGEWEVKNITHIQPAQPSGKSLLIRGSNKYINFNALTGSSGYGFRDLAGIPQVKSSSGSWEEILTISSGGTGTVTSVAMTVPTGLSISGSPITISGTLALTYSSGYEGMLSADATNWNSFYNTPSGRITAGTNLTWSTNTLNVDDPFSVANLTVTNTATTNKLIVSTKNIGDYLDFFNGTFIESFNATTTSDGSVITMTLANSANYTSGLTMSFSSGDVSLATPTSTPLTAGSDASPTENFVYITEANKFIEVSTSGWPSNVEHNRIAYFNCPSAGFVQTNGCYINQNWNDDVIDENNQGDQAHISERLRREQARYFSGVDGNGTDNYLTPTVGNVDLKSTSGIVYQKHAQTFSAFDTSSGDMVLVKNWNGDAFHDITNLYNITRDSASSTIGNNKYFNLVIWGVANKTGQFTPMMINLPSGSYNSQSEAENDTSGFDDLTIPDEFKNESSTGFLIARITIQMKTGGGTWIVASTVDLRGLTPQSATGGTAAGTLVNFPDNTFTIFDETDITKIIDFSVGGITTGNTRTLTIQDADGTLAYVNNQTFTGLTQFLNATSTQFTVSGSTWFTSITGSTQCLEVDTNGFLSGTGSACGAGGGKFVDGDDVNDAVYTTGNVGIGTTTPEAPLTVYTDTMETSFEVRQPKRTFLILRPDSAGTYEEFDERVGCNVGSHWQCVDEVTADDATTHVETDASNARDTYNLSASGIPAGSTINSVTVYAKVQYEASNDTDWYIMIRSGSTDALSGEFTEGSDWRYRSYEWTTDPDTGVAWTIAAIDALEAGGKAGSASAAGVSITQVYVIVDYISSTVDTVFSINSNNIETSGEIKASYFTATSPIVSTFESGIISGGNIISDTDSTDDLGSSAKFWANAYVDNVYVSSDTYIRGLTTTFYIISGVNSLGINLGGDPFFFSGGSYIDFNDTVRPFSDSSKDLGASARFWDETYTDELILQQGTMGATAADQVRLAGLDLSAGDSGLHIKTENDTEHLFASLVGISTTSPAFTLDVYGDFRVGEEGNADVLTINAGTGIITSTGAWDLGGATSFEIPNSSSPTIDVLGKIAINTDNKDLRFHDGTEERVLQPTFDKSMVNIASSSVDIFLNSFDTATTTYFAWCPDGAVTLEKIYCGVDTGTVIMRTATSTEASDSFWNEIICDSDGQEDESLSNNNILDRECLVIEIGSQTGNPNYFNRPPTFTFSNTP